MPLFHIVILALIQGITEFLPISSSGHLVLAHTVMNADTLSGWEEDLTMDIAVHIGTLFAVLLYFWRDIFRMLSGLTGLVTSKKDTEGTNLLLHVIIGSLPVIAAGFALHMWEPAWLRSLTVMAWATVIFGIILWAADRFGKTDYTLTDMTFKNAFLIGLAQILALIPGTSRSGITMTAARFLGFSRRESAHFSLLLATVAISGAGALTGLDLWQSGNVTLGMDALLAIILSFFAAMIAIALMMKWLEKSSFTPFAIYRIILGLILLGLIYSGTV